MKLPTIEAGYPLSFRQEDAEWLGEQLRQRNSVDIVGMKRVGISNFLRFFLYHKDIVKKYIDTNNGYLFIPVDLNDLVERELFPFWTLTLKRIVDRTEHLSIPENEKRIIESLFVKSIQTQDLFLAIDSVRQALRIIISNNIYPTIFFLRFDRIREVATPSFFDNLQGLRDATHHKLSFVFTSYRSLDELSPSVFTKASLSVFCQEMYLRLARKDDMRIIYRTYKDRYQLDLSPLIMNALLDLVQGNVQYLQLALITLSENANSLPETAEALYNLLQKDERITLQSEELWESLTQEEQAVLVKVSRQEKITENDRKNAIYLWETGLINKQGRKERMFNRLLQDYVEQIVDKHSFKQTLHFSKKEHELFSYLEKNVGQLCDREGIIEAVWPESKEFGISDWAIDRLVARVRTKLRQQQSPYEIKTIRTRGYQLNKSD